MPAVVTYTYDSLHNVVLALTESDSVPVLGGTNLDTAGYIPYVSSTGVLSIDKTAVRMLFWDATNHRLGIGTATPSTALEISAVGGGGVLNMLRLTGTSNTGGAMSGTLSFLGSTGKEYRQFLGASAEVIFRDSTRGVNVLTITTLGAVTYISPMVTVGTDFAITAPTVPATAAAAGVPGQIAWASGFIYVCISSGVWQRVAIATW